MNKKALLAFSAALVFQFVGATNGYSQINRLKPKKKEIDIEQYFVNERIIEYKKLGYIQPGTIIVSFKDRRLYYIKNHYLAISYPIAIPAKRHIWYGVERITNKKKCPNWYPTQEMITEFPFLPRMVPGCDRSNALGSNAIYLGKTLYRIHGTYKPLTIGTSDTRGCIRLYDHEAKELYAKVNIGDFVVVTSKQVAMRH